MRACYGGRRQDDDWRDAGFKELGQALLAYLEGGDWTLKRRGKSDSRYLLGRDYRGDPDCLEQVWAVDESLSERRLGPSKATAALRDPSSSRFFGILCSRFKQVCMLRIAADPSQRASSSPQGHRASQQPAHAASTLVHRACRARLASRR